jgi:hypothetical protein
MTAKSVVWQSAIPRLSDFVRVLAFWHVAIAVAVVELRKRGDPNPGMGTPPAATGYNTAYARLRIDGRRLVNQVAPALSKEAANLLLFMVQ